VISWAALPAQPRWSSSEPGETAGVEAARGVADMLSGRRATGRIGAALMATFGNLFNHFLVECGQIIRFAAGYQATVDHHLAIHPLGAGVLQILAQRRPGSHLPPAHALRVDQGPGAVANRSDGFSRLYETANELHRLYVGAQRVRIDDATRQHQ